MAHYSQILKQTAQSLASIFQSKFRHPVTSHNPPMIVIPFVAILQTKRQVKRGVVGKPAFLNER